MNQSLSSLQLPNPISLPMVQGVLTIGEAFALALVSFPPDPKAGADADPAYSFLFWNHFFGLRLIS